MQTRERGHYQSDSACTLARAPGSSRSLRASAATCRWWSRAGARARATSSPCMLLTASVGDHGAGSRPTGRTRRPRCARSPRSSTTASASARPRLGPYRPGGALMVSFALQGVGVSCGIAIGRRAARLACDARSRALHRFPPRRSRPKSRASTVAIKEVQKELEGLHVGDDQRRRAGRVRRVSRRPLDDPERPDAVEVPEEDHPRATLQRRVGAHPANGRAGRAVRARSRTRTCASARATSCRCGERVLKRLMGKPGALPPPVAEEQTILVAHDLSPADVIQFKHHRYGAFLTDVGGVTSHTAIVARSLNVPAVVATHNARQLIRDSGNADRRRRERRGHHQSRPRGARRIPLEAERARARRGRS